MLLKTILNSIEKHPLFVYETPKVTERNGQKVIHFPIKPRKGSLPICSSCHKKAPGYDTQPMREFSYVPIWGFLVFFLYSPRRVNCSNCGVKVEEILWPFLILTQFKYKQ